MQNLIRHPLNKSLVNQPKNQGFTLIEVLVALTIFAVLSALSYRSLSALLQTRERITHETTRWREVMLFFNRVDTDLRQHVNRPVTIGRTIQPAFFGKIGGLPNEVLLSFSRFGNPQQNGALMDTQRIAYRLKAGSVEMLIWPALDVEEDTKPAAYPILSGVKNITIRYMHNKTLTWLNTWPTNEDQAAAFPKAIDIGVTLATGEKLNKVVNF